MSICTFQFPFYARVLRQLPYLTYRSAVLIFQVIYVMALQALLTSSSHRRSCCDDNRRITVLQSHACSNLLNMPLIRVFKHRNVDPTGLIHRKKIPQAQLDIVEWLIQLLA